MGNVSYSYYLLHGLALQAFFSVAQRFISPGHDGLALALLLPAWLATLPPCLMLFLLIERPLSLAPKSATARSPAAALKS
jgi:peptidoglycan/LPS O-acetylase OafA/YrhL